MIKKKTMVERKTLIKRKMIKKKKLLQGKIGEVLHHKLKSLVLVQKKMLPAVAAQGLFFRERNKL
jgi:hypothetical protein